MPRSSALLYGPLKPRKKRRVERLGPDLLAEALRTWGDENLPGAWDRIEIEEGMLGDEFKVRSIKVVDGVERIVARRTYSQVELEEMVTY